MLANGTVGVKLEGIPGYVAIDAISAPGPLCCRCQAKTGEYGHPNDDGNSNRWYCAECYCALMEF